MLHIIEYSTNGWTSLEQTIALANSVETYYTYVNHSSGTIKMVREADTCKNNHIKISWNQTGHPGAVGAPGVDGADGAVGPINLIVQNLMTKIK